jgi:hypothetical protein
MLTYYYALISHPCTSTVDELLGGASFFREGQASDFAHYWG